MHIGISVHIGMDLEQCKDLLRTFDKMVSAQVRGQHYYTT
jgi:hypothetical protein